MATDSTLNYRAVKRLGLDYRHFGEPLPLFKRLGGRFFPKNSPFQRRVEKVGLGADRFREVLHRVGKKRFNLVRSSSGLQGDVLVRAILARQIALFLAEANPSYLRRCANGNRFFAYVA